MDAVKRGQQMLRVPMIDLPPLAREFAVRLCNEVGMCIEVMLTAYAVYAQLVEGLPCDDDLYQPRCQDIEWFEQRMVVRKDDS